MNLIATNAMLFQILLESSEKLDFLDQQYEILKNEKNGLLSKIDILHEEIIDQKR